MIELDSLKFTVITDDLVTAVTKVQALQTAVTNLNKPLTENAKISAKVAQESSKIVVAQEKEKKAKLDTAAAAARKEAAEARAAKATERVTASTKQQTTVLEKNQSIYEFMLQGYSKGQATTLAAAKAQGALAEELLQVGKVLQDQRKLMGGDPFDKSMQGLLSLKNALVDMDAENRMVNQGIQLTSKQYKELSRDLQRITETSIATGESFETMTARLNNHKKQFVEVATEINKLTEVEKERERNQRLQANAIRAIATEDEKMESILRSLNVAQNEHVTVSEKAARSIANYERNLRLAGITGEQASIKLDKFRKSAMMAAQADEKRKVDMLSRALAPQISDVVVSLGSGMNPMTVLLQQGLQVRDLIGLSGVAAENLKESFKSAASDMVSSIKGTAVALGSLLIGGLMDAGKAILNFGVNVTGTNFMLEKLRAILISLNGETGILVKAFDVAGKGATALAAGGVAALGVGFLSYLFALKDVVTEQNNLVRNLALTGASLGLNKDQAIALANSLDGISESKATEVLSEMAKAGGFTKDQFDEVTKAAVQLNKYAGISIEDTVKNFAKLQDDPSKALAEFAAKNGLVEIAVIKQVKALQDQKKYVEAADVAIKAYSESQVAAAAIMEESLHPITKLWIDIKSAIGGAWEAIKEFARSDVVVKPLSTAFELVRNVVYDVWAAVKLIGGTIGTIIAVAEQLVTGGGISGAAAVVKAAKQDFKDGLAAREKFMSEMQKPVSTQKDRSGNASAATAWLRAQKKDGKSDAEKEADRVGKLSEKYLKEFVYNAIEADSVVGELTKSQEALIKMMTSPDWDKLPNKAEILAKAYEAIGKEQDIAANKQRIELEKELGEIYAANNQKYNDYLNTIKSSIEGLADSNRSLEEEIELIGLEETAIHNVNKERLKALILKKRNESMPSSAAELILLEQELALMERQVELLDEKFAKQNFVQMRDGIADAIETGLFEGGKAGSQKLRDIIEAELRRPITVFIKAVVGDILGGSGVGGSSTVSSVTKLFDTFKNFSSLGSNLGASLGSLGSWMQYGTNPFSQQGAMLAAQEAGMGTTAGSLSQFGSMAGNALMGNMLYKGLSNGYSISKGLDIVGNIASLFGPVYGAIGGLVNRAFGRKLKDVGIQGTFSGEDSFAGNTYQFLKGGWFRSDKTKLGKLDPILASGLGQAYGGLTATNKAMGDYLGINSSERLSGFKSNVKFSTNGLNEEQIQKKLEEVMGTVAEKQAKLLLGTYETVQKKVGWFSKSEQVWKPSEFVEFGETALEALTRLSGSLKAVNTFLENTNNNLLAFSLVGADMASSLVDLFGGIDNFSNVSGAYYQNFFTDQERLAKGHELLSKAFTDLNISMPSTVSAYRKLVESQDLTTESGRETFTALLTLSSAFYEIKTASEEAASTLIEEINRLRGVVSTSSVNGFEGTKASFMQAISLAQAGDSAAMASIPGLSQSLESMFMSSAGSLEDVNRFRSWLANSIGSGIPAFASGGFHSGGLRLVGENGPELEMTGPSRIFSNNDTMQMLSSEGVIRAIEVMNGNLEMLRAEVRADVQHNAKTAKLLDRVIPDGDSIKTSAI